MISLTADPWLSETMRRPVHRVSIALGGCDGVAAPQGFYYGRLPTTDVAGVASLSDLGFHVVDTSVTLERDLKASAFRQSAACGVRVRDAVPTDRDAVTAIARGAFRWSRFHLDPSIPRDSRG